MTHPNENADDHAGFHRIGTGSIEVFWSNSFAIAETSEKGWFWWPCFPGCLPNGDAYGPFSTSTEAYNAAQED